MNSEMAYSHPPCVGPFQLVGLTVTYTLFQNGRHFLYSFVSMQIGPYGLAFKRKIQKNIKP